MKILLRLNYPFNFTTTLLPHVAVIISTYKGTEGLGCKVTYPKIVRTVI